ncbi:MAG: DUF3386 family protein [Acidobacteria bacterium]|nr:DUF3386 family protein [Acidobacteriota bacterium]
MTRQGRMTLRKGFQIAMFLGVAWVGLAGTGVAQEGRGLPLGTIDLREYYPLQDGNTWLYQYKTNRPDGQVQYKIKSQTAAGDFKLSDTLSATKLVEDNGWFYLVSVNASHYRMYGESETRGLETVNPPFTFMDIAYIPGKVYRAPHSPSEGSDLTSEATYYGIESVNVPAGSFKNCLKTVFKFTTESGQTFSTISYLAKGVGVVKKEFSIFSPAAGQTIRSEQELIHATIGGTRLGGEAARTVNVAEYFPFHQGDIWTYDWTYRMADGTSKTETRTRTFEGTKFVNAGAAFKLISNRGDYQYYSLDRYGVRIHESGERGMTFYFDPPILMARNDMVIGRPYSWSMREEDGKHWRTFTSTLDGFETVTTPMGTFDNCVRVTVVMDGSSSRTKNVYYYARGVGIVSYLYESMSKKDNRMTIALDGRLKEALIDRNKIATAAEGKALWDKLAAELAAAVDNPEARRVFREASENRYVWDDQFKGFESDFFMTKDGGTPLSGKIKCDPNLNITVEGLDPADAALVHVEMSQFVTHRQRRPFNEFYGPDKAKFRLGQVSAKGTEVFVEGDAMGSNYVIADKQVKLLSRSMGKMHFTINNKSIVPAEDGRYIAVDYEVTYYSSDTNQEIGKAQFRDEYFKMGNYWMPKSRTHLSTLKGEPGRLEIQMKNVAFLK